MGNIYRFLLIGQLSTTKRKSQYESKPVSTNNVCLCKVNFPVGWEVKASKLFLLKGLKIARETKGHGV